jgi:ABC transporter DrrB family efflux protein
LWDLLFELSAQGVTLFVTTHYMDEAERCTDVGYIFQSQLLVLGEPGELKRLPEVTPAGTKRYELQVASPAERLAELRKMPGVHDATLFGDTIHLLVSDDLPRQALLEDLHVHSDETPIREIAPTLEDVFVTLTRAAEQRRNQSGPSPTIQAPESPWTASQRDKRHGDTAAAGQAVSPRPPASPAGVQPVRGSTGHGFWAILIKEFFHIRRQPSTIIFMLVVPVVQTLIFGVAIDNQIEHIPTVVYDLDGRRQGREFIEAMVNTRNFEVVARVQDDEAFRRAMTSGRAKVGVKIPPDYSDRLMRGQQVQVQVLIDGSDSQVATTALNSVNLLGVNQSINVVRPRAEASGASAASRDKAGRLVLPIEVRPRLLYNPDLESAHFFVPGLVGIILQLVTLFLTSFAVVRERELGTLEQLFVTPVGRAGLLLGKLAPYAIVGLGETLMVLTVMVYAFQVPIHGNLLLLISLSSLFLVCALGLGLLVSTLAKTQVEALQFAFLIMLPSVLLSGFMFPREEMPTVIYIFTFAIPVTYFIEILRGIVLRGADMIDLLPWIAGLTVCCVAVLMLSVFRFRKQLG